VRKKQGAEVVGDVTSPKFPRKPRASRNQDAGQGDANVKKNAGKTIVPGKSGIPARVSGQKRKEYRPKNITTTNTDDSALDLSLVPVKIGYGCTSIPVATVDGDNSFVVEPNKKQKMVSPSSSDRSADQAAAACQPCHTQ
jgi:hypothetical protein